MTAMSTTWSNWPHFLKQFTFKNKSLQTDSESVCISLAHSCSCISEINLRYIKILNTKGLLKYLQGTAWPWVPLATAV